MRERLKEHPQGSPAIEPSLGILPGSDIRAGIAVERAQALLSRVTDEVEGRPCRVPYAFSRTLGHLLPREDDREYALSLPRSVVREISAFEQLLRLERQSIVEGTLRGQAFLNYLRELSSAASRRGDAGLADLVVDTLLRVQEPRQTDSRKPGCHHFSPTSAAMVPRLVDCAQIGGGDVVADIGCGNGRLLALLHLCTGCRGIGVEILPELVAQGRRLMKSNGITAIQLDHRDALDTELSEIRTVVMYAPFYASVFEQMVRHFETRAKEGPFRVVLHGPMEIFLENSAQFINNSTSCAIRRFDAISEH